jgi:hypothetical protein
MNATNLVKPKRARTGDDGSQLIKAVFGDLIDQLRQQIEILYDAVKLSKAKLEAAQTEKNIMQRRLEQVEKRLLGYQQAEARALPTPAVAAEAIDNHGV